MAVNPAAFIESLFVTESRRVYATLVKQLGDFDLAEDALSEAFAAALSEWTATGIPENPRAWLVSTGRYKAIDACRRNGRHASKIDEIARYNSRIQGINASKAQEDIEDDRLRLIFTCCHPAIDPSIQIPLTLREVCGLTTEEISRAFLTTTSTMAQRIVRGKSKIRDAGIPFEIPSADNLSERLEGVLNVVYLVFTEGYSATQGDSLTRSELSQEAIRLGRLLVELLPDPEAIGLLALMLIQESRREARTDALGDIILLEDQDRSKWNVQLIQEGLQLVDRALATRRFGSLTIQAAIASAHARAQTAKDTNWHQIVAWYDALMSINASSIIELNRAVAIAMRDGPSDGLELIHRILNRGELSDYHLLHAARADLYRRINQPVQAKEAYQLAYTLAKQEPERRFILSRINSL